MKSLTIFALCIISVLSADNSQPVPVVLWHGMGDDCCHEFSMGSIKKIIEEEIPGVYVHSLMIGSNPIADTENGFFKNVNSQIDEACKKIQSDQKLKNGYHSVGFSQGGQFLRGLAQRCPDPPMKNLISIGGQHQGIYGLPHCPAAEWICNTVRKMLNYGAYVGFVQNSLVQAEYWHDPMAEQEYKEKSIFIADINNELHQNETYKQNLLKLENLVLVKFLKDTMVVPVDSEWFGFYKENDVNTMLPMEETALYTEDRIGLKQLNESNRLKFLSVEADHLQIGKETFVNEIVNPYLKQH